MTDFIKHTHNTNANTLRYFKKFKSAMALNVLRESAHLVNT